MEGELSRIRNEEVAVSNVVFVHPDGREEVHEGREGQSLMKVATSNLVDGIVGECGGDLSCATCHVFVDEEWFSKLGPRSADEEDMLEVTSEIPTEYSRLSCQIACSSKLDGIVVRIPETQR
jgi:2Fe-2S ferredoxin